MKQKLNPLAFGTAGAIMGAVFMLGLSIFASFGIYASAMRQMMKWQMFYSFGVGGAFAGMLEAAVLCFLLFTTFAWIYNRLST